MYGFVATVSLADFLSNMVVELDDILDYVTGNCYDYYHGFGPTTWIIDVVPFFNHLANKLEVTPEELGKLYDEARKRVHGC